MFVFGIAGQGALRFDRLRALGKDGNAVERFLPMPNRAIARAFKFFDGKAFVLRLDLLQAGNVGLGFFQPLEQPGKARFDAVDIVVAIRMPATLAAHGYCIKPKSWTRSHNRPVLADWSP